MGWIRKALHALTQGRDITVRPAGFHIYPRISSQDELTLSPAEPQAVQRRDIVFLSWKGTHALRLVIEAGELDLRVGYSLNDEGVWVQRDAVIGTVTHIAKQYAVVDPENAAICYDLLWAGSPPTEAWGDYGEATFDFRARYDYWDLVLTSSTEFEAGDLSEFIGMDLEGVEQSELHCDLENLAERLAAFRASFVRSGQYGKKGSYAASYMPQDEALRIIRECITEYEETRGN
jgi:hypothetical protein